MIMFQKVSMKRVRPYFWRAFLASESSCWARSFSLRWSSLRAGEGSGDGDSLEGGEEGESLWERRSESSEWEWEWEESEWSVEARLPCSGAASTSRNSSRQNAFNARYCSPVSRPTNPFSGSPLPCCASPSLDRPPVVAPPLLVISLHYFRARPLSYRCVFLLRRPNLSLDAPYYFLESIRPSGNV